MVATFAQVSIKTVPAMASRMGREAARYTFAPNGERHMGSRVMVFTPGWPLGNSATS